MDSNGYEFNRGDDGRVDGEYSIKYVNGRPVGASGGTQPPCAGGGAHYTGQPLDAPRYSPEAGCGEAFGAEPLESGGNAHGSAPGYSAPEYYHRNETQDAREEKRREARERRAALEGKMKAFFAGKQFRRLLAGFLFAVFCAGASALSAYAVVSSMSRDQGVQQFGGTNANQSSRKDNIITGEELSGQQIYDMACEQVVGVRIAVETTNIFGQTSSSAVSGSGFIISEDGYILTNYHVVEYSVLYGYEATVMLYGDKSYTAKLIGYDKDNDVALIKIDASGLNTVSFGDSDNMSVGEKVYIVGNPLGELAYTMTSGIVSALDRVINTGSSLSINMFQIDAAVNSGNSGGPVYNSRGEVIGIVTAKYSDTGVEGLGFAIPIDDASDIANQLAEHGYVTGKAYLGVSVIDSSRVNGNGTMGGFGWGGAQTGSSLPAGAYVYSVEKSSSAEKAGVETGDVITKLGDVEIGSTGDLTNALRKSFKAGDSEKLTVYRDGGYITLDVVFDEYVPR